jgi:hypothetical protein
MTQTDSTFNQQFQYDHFTVRAQFGLGKSRMTNTIGDQMPKGGFTWSPVLKAEYTKNLYPSMGFVFGGGIGADIYSQQILFTSVVSRMFLDFSFAPEFRIPVKSNFISFSQGIGFKLTSRLTATHSGSDDIGNWSISEFYFENIALPYFKSRLAYGISLKNRDILSISFDYQYVTRDLFRGEFIMNQDQLFSAGNIKANRSTFSVGLGYSFTMNQRKEQLKNIKLQTGVNHKVAKKELKIQRRFVDPKTTMIGLNSGFFMNVSKIDDPNGVFDSYTSPAFNASLTLEQGWKHNLFFQSGFAVSSYWSWVGLQNSYGMASGSNAFIGYSLNGGMMKRFNLKNNRNLINLSAGLNLVIHPRSKLGISSGSGSLAASSETLLVYYYNDEVYRNVFPTVYFGAGKDFRMTKHLSFTVDYRFQLGVIKVMGGDLNYYEADQVTKIANRKIDGTAHSINFGLKYRFLREKFKD